MNKLPNEVLEKIFQRLPHRTRYECTLVCRQWLHTAERSLYVSVDISKQQKFDKFMNALKLNPHRGSQVIFFQLRSEPLVGFDKRILCSLLPNVQHIILLTPRFPIPPKVVYDYETIQEHPLKPTIEIIEEEGYLDFTFYLIKSDLCSRLQSLDLDCIPNRMPNPIYQLRNMPVLKRLTIFLRGFSIRIDDIEQLHRNVPSIEDFELKSASLFPTENLPEIEPSSCIKTITWRCFLRSDSDGGLPLTHFQWLQYIQKKYSNLERLAFENYSLLSYDETKEVLYSGWLPLIHSIGPQLKCIEPINMVPGVDICRRLDGCGCKLEKLKIYSRYNNLKLDEFIQSNQRHYLKELYIEKVHPVIDVSLKDSKLESLTIYYADSGDDEEEQPVILNKLLRLLPDSLKHLEIFNAIVDYDIGDDVQSSITSLTVNMNGNGCVRGDLESDAYKFCPKLKSISVSVSC